jgi:signal transduction histidine kinase/ligand-binding sensor domain-containing protein/DNA-binding response OmpR family regulator
MSVKYSGTIFSIIITQLLSHPGYAGTTELRFQHLSIANGLSNNTVRSIIQDSRGFMWFGTSSGLNKFDGYNFTIYKSDPNEPNDVSCLEVLSICEDTSGDIWVGTKSCGLYLYKREKDKVEYFALGPDSIGNFSDFSIRSILEDSRGKIWVGSANGLYSFHRTKGVVGHYLHQSNDSTSLSNSMIYSIHEDQKNRLWVGTNNGLNLFDQKSGRFRRYFYDAQGVFGPILTIYEDEHSTLWLSVYSGGLIRFNPSDGSYQRYLYSKSNKNTIRSNNVFDLKGDGQGHLYIGTENGGLNVLDLNSGEFDYYASKIEEKTSLTSNSIYSIYYSRDHILWLGTFNGGMNYASPQYLGFRYYQTAKDGLNNPHILSITESKDGNLWIGTDGGGLNYFDRKTGKFAYYLHDENEPLSLGANEVTTILEDKRGHIWAGLYRAGLDLVDPQTGRFTHFCHVPEDSNTIQHNLINTLLEDSRGNFYVGTETGMDCFDRTTKTFRRWKDGIITTGVLSVIEDKLSNLWVGTYGGLSFLDINADTARKYLYIDEASTIRNIVTTLYEDSKGHLWIGTLDGLYLFDKASQRFIRYTLDAKSLNNEVAGIVEDNTGNLWVSNNHNLIKMEGAVELPKDQRFINYGIYDGIKKLYRSRQGEILFGGNYGLNAFFPKDIVKNEHVPPVLFTSLKIFGKDAEIGFSESPLLKPISETKEMILTHSQSVITFEFAALNYIFPEKNQYAYFLEGFDKEWNYSGNQRTATYTNLDPGQYVFRVKGSNNDGVWNEKGASVHIRIVPPWWKTTWAFLFYVLFVGGFSYGIWRFELNRARMKHELALEHLHAEKLEELDQMKTRFFTNITHEFRTPLTLIIGPIKQMLINEAAGQLKDQLQMILRNSQKLFRLINQLLDLAKLEAGYMPLRCQKTNIVALLRDLVMLFMPLAEQKQISLRFAVLGDHDDQSDCIDVYIDQDKLEKIISNLLSNAIKFAPESGQVNTYVRKENDSVFEIIVADNGTGFSKEHQDKIFNRFYQVESSNAQFHEGTGIGLALTKELVELHRGTIQVESGNDGSTFTVRLPLGKAHLAENEIISEAPANAEISSTLISWYGYLDDNNGERTEKPRASKNAPLILIVENNIDLRLYLRRNLYHEYQVIEAKDGQEGIEKAFDKIPDLIVSDVMMPVMGGFEMCERIKKDERTSHIPVILLTARSEGENKIEGLETGADDYITKPFEMRELHVRIRNLIELRRQLRLRFHRKEGLKPEEIAATSFDERFLKKALSIIEENMNDPNFSVAKFARRIGISRVQLYRKIHSLTGQSTSEFIRVIRLNRAANLLKQRHDTVTQIAFLVGFNSSSYFSRSFYKHFGVTPSDYIENSHP